MSTLALAMVCATGATGCKSATGLRAGNLGHVPPVLLHAPMGIERVRFATRDTGVEFEDKQSLLETAAGGTSTHVSNGYVYQRTTTSVTRSATTSHKGFERMGAYSWASNVHVDTSRYFFFPLIFAVGRAYVEAQGEVVDVAVRR